MKSGLRPGLKLVLGVGPTPQSKQVLPAPYSSRASHGGGATSPGKSFGFQPGAAGTRLAGLRCVPDKGSQRGYEIPAFSSGFGVSIFVYFFSKRRHPPLESVAADVVIFGDMLVFLQYPHCEAVLHSQTDDKARKCKNPFEQKKIRKDFCLLRRYQMQNAVIYERVNSLFCIFISLSCGLFHSLPKHRLCQCFEEPAYPKRYAGSFYIHSFRPRSM